MAKLEDHVWNYAQTELRILRKLKKEGDESWKEKFNKTNGWLAVYKWEIVEDEKYIFSLKEFN